jgi:hypothetical protein
MTCAQHFGNEPLCQGARWGQAILQFSIRRDDWEPVALCGSYAEPS